MKVVLTGNEGKFRGSKNAALLPLVPEETIPLTKENSVGLLLSTNPANADAPKYKKQVRILKGEGEDVRTIIDWHSDVNSSFNGLGLDDATSQDRMLGTMLAGTAKALYEGAKNALCIERRETEAMLAFEDDAHGDDAARAAARDAIMAQDMFDFLQEAHIQLSIRDMIGQLMPRQVAAKIKRYLRRECRKPANFESSNLGSTFASHER